MRGRPKVASARGSGRRRQASRALRLDLLRGQWNRLPRRVRAPALPTTVIILAFLYPYYNESLPDIPVFGSFPSVDTAVTMLIFIMMAPTRSWPWD